MKKHNTTFWTFLSKSKRFSRSVVILLIVAMLMPNVTGLAYADEVTGGGDEGEADKQYVWGLICGKEEHTHDDSCYAAPTDPTVPTDPTDGSDVLEISGVSYSAAPETEAPGTNDGTPATTDRKLTCSKEEHVHTTACYGYKLVEWDMADTQRPGASEDVSHTPGGEADKAEADKNWDIFYDADKDVYKITFKIDANTEAMTQVIDLTQALELLGKYAETGKKELEDA